MNNTKQLYKNIFHLLGIIAPVTVAIGWVFLALNMPQVAISFCGAGIVLAIIAVIIFIIYLLM